MSWTSALDSGARFLKVWPPVWQHQHHLGTIRQAKLLDPILDQLNQKLWGRDPMMIFVLTSVFPLIPRLHPR